MKKDKVVCKMFNWMSTERGVIKKKKSNRRD